MKLIRNMHNQGDTVNTDNIIQYGLDLEKLVFVYAKGLNYMVSVGRIGTLECDFIVRNTNLDYAYIQVAFTIANS